MSKGGQTKTRETKQQTRLAPGDQDFIQNFLRPLGRQAAGVATGQQGSFFAGPTQAQQEALSRMGAGAVEGAGNLGFSPQSFDPSQAQQFFNPFQEQVVKSMQDTFDRQREAALTQAAQEATQAGAFGGSRSGLLQAQALEDVNQNEAQQLANLRRQGFSNAMNRAQQAHQFSQNLGFGAAQAAQQGRLSEAELALQGAGQQFQSGERLRQIRQQQLQEPLFRQRQALQMANLGFGQSLGQNTTGTRTIKTPGKGLFGNLLGAGMTAAGMFLGGPAGASAGSSLSDLIVGGGGGVSMPLSTQNQGLPFSTPIDASRFRPNLSALNFGG